MDTADIRALFAQKYFSNQFVIDKSMAKVVEIVGASFVADQNEIFGLPNPDWYERELQWYDSLSLNVNDIPPPIPAIWKQVATPSGEINSNYGWAIYSDENGNQYGNVLKELKKNPFSRRAQLIYTRPSMQKDFSRNGMSDFMCTTSVQYFIRDNKLIAFVSMRSNDAWAGYRGDLHWQQTVQKRLAWELEVIPGEIIWNVGSLHVYESQFYLIDHFLKTGQYAITKKSYDELYKG